MIKIKAILLKYLKYIFYIFVSVFSVVILINLIVIVTTIPSIKKIDKIQSKDHDAIIVLGAGILSPSKPTIMLRDRLDTAYELYKNGYAKKIIVSGDHGSIYYDEVSVMKKYLMDKGVKSSDIFKDHAGFSTYDTMVRAKKIFQVKKPIVVTQRYHIYRALYIGKAYNEDIIGVTCKKQPKRGKMYRIVREEFARIKDFFICILKVDPKFLGEKIPLDSNGDITN